ncbi:hypothetical protein SADUNF_Sadunf08G0153000 [Salix dunnii]|uniref:Uncharacterized protein n=1 Tax=Salix dunnii TaxID=1413687 RepID=A0A835N1T0_9ROSI|nr:hypothetical protein SADUNF_Sadunf08G0153000 [Salix dunnii]
MMLLRVKRSWLGGAGSKEDVSSSMVAYKTYWRKGDKSCELRTRATILVITVAVLAGPWLLRMLVKGAISVGICSKVAPDNTNSEEYEAQPVKLNQNHINYISQNGGDVIYYWGKWQQLWQEIDAIDDGAMSCKADIEKYTTVVNSQQIYIFLAGMDSSMDGVHGEVLAAV